MAISNQGLPLSELKNGQPILVNNAATIQTPVGAPPASVVTNGCNPDPYVTYTPPALSASGTLIHIAEGFNDYLWVWACNIHATETARLTIYKGTTSAGYAVDTVVDLPPLKGKIQVEPGIILNNSMEYWARVTVAGVATAGRVAISGFIHRRVGEC